MAVKRAIVGQFGHPRGAAGNVAGWVMAHRPSNRQRNSWVASLLDVQPTDLVLEIGFGPGLAIASQPRCPGAARTTSLDAASEITDLLQAAGFTQPRTEILDLDPPVVCVLAVNQASAYVQLPDS